MFAMDVGDVSVGHKHSANVTNVEIQSPTSTNRHQLEVTNITVTNITYFLHKPFDPMFSV